MGALGDPDYRVFLLGRGGIPNYAEIPWADVSFDRRLDDVSSATVRAPMPSSDEFCRVVSGQLSWSREIGIWRADQDEPDWVGPIVDVRRTSDGITFTCRDLATWLERRRIHDDYDPITDDLVEIFRTIVEDGLAPDTSPSITLDQVDLSGTTGERKYLASEYRRVADEMRELARIAVDWTMIGRTLRYGSEIGEDTEVTLYDPHVENPELVELGLQAATEVTVKGSSGGAGSVATFGGNTQQIVYTAGGIDLDMGLLEVTVSELQARDQGSALVAAVGTLSLLNPPPETLKVELTKNAPFRFDQLIIGSRMGVGLEVGCRRIAEQRRLSSLSVSVRASDDGVKETISAELTPAGEAT